ncbi:MAG: response regulator [Desulfobacteraceae bacterium]
MDPLIQILHLEDDPMDAELVRARIEEANLKCRITRVQTKDAFESALSQNHLDIILADYRLPMYDGLSALRRTLQLRPDIPFIFVSGTIGEEAAIEALTKGATDYVLKQGLKRLGPAVQRALREAQILREGKQAEKALAQSEAKMRNILDSVDEGFIVVDHRYRILSANKAFCDMAALDENEVIGRPCHGILHQSTLPCIEMGEDCPVKSTFRSGRVHSTLHIHPHESGTQRYFELKSYPIVDASDTVTSVIETVRDVTEKHKLQEQLVQSQKMESIGRLAGGVAHDFNNTLSIIIGYTELAMDQVDPIRPLFADLQEIRKAAERSAALTRQLLAFARKQTVVPRVLDLNKTVAGILKMLRPLIGEDIELDWRPGEGVWPVKMDPSQIDQILANLCVNARDAIAGIGRITIETASLSCGPIDCAQLQEIVPGEYVLLTVSDNGAGMGPDVLSKIFEPFFTTKEIGQGTGLGLATVYGIVKQNNGFIEACSEPGQGTTFKIYMPRHTATTTAAVQKSQPIDVPGGDETILVVEDERSILKMAKSMLEKLGYRVLAASNPGEALRMANAYEGEINLLIVDVIMPEMNGRDLADEVVELHPEAACLFMSGYSGDIIAHHGLLSESVHFIQKPFSRQDLAVKVREILDAR